MRWLLVHPGPNFSVADVHAGWAEALRGLGVEVAEYNLDRRLTFYDQALLADDISDEQGRTAVHKALTREQAITLAAQPILGEAMAVWPHVVFLTSAFFVPELTLKVLRARGMKIVMLFTESPYQDTGQLRMAQYADIALLNDPVNLGKFRAVAGRAEYMPHAYRPSVHHPGNGQARSWDLAFVGTGFPSRVKFFEAMDLDGCSVLLRGPWLDLPEDSPLRDWTMTGHEDCVDNADTAGIYRQARTGINFYRRESEDGHAGQGWACGPREIEMAACGLWFARDGRPESDALFPMLPAFRSPQEASEAIRWALAHEGKRQKAAAKARAAIAGRTFDNHARRLLAMLDN
jgi:hypothetical protein